MNETMKMKELKEKLSAEGYEVSERMVKYYIEIGILPVPEYPYPNQARYSRIHLIRLMRIGKMKEEGHSFFEIKNQILKEQEEIKQLAQRKGIPYEEMRGRMALDLKEQSDFIFSSMWASEKQFGKQELLEVANCEKIIFDLAVDTGAIKQKQLYNRDDLFVLVAVNNLFRADENAGESANIIEKISEISKINNIASQLAHIYETRPNRSWIYDDMLHKMLEAKLSANGDEDTFPSPQAEKTLG